MLTHLKLCVAIARHKLNWVGIKSRNSAFSARLIQLFSGHVDTILIWFVVYVEDCSSYISISLSIYMYIFFCIFFS